MKEELSVYKLVPKRLDGMKFLILARDFAEAAQKAVALMKADKELKDDDIGSLELYGDIDA